MGEVLFFLVIASIHRHSTHWGTSRSFLHIQFLFPSSQYHTHSVSSHVSPLHHLGISTPRFYLTSVLSATSRISTTIMYIHAYTHRIGLLTLFPLRFCLDRRLLHYRIRREYYVVLSLESVSV
ncbi:hypothetical protein SCLCIDRAFT_1001218 [Scleroderma citrinum Foug A]|uniref:Uncharacterized protein n=1 Tax=Scleroderma citrinum Foug A TaxID=1036808 RepID=A0A0C3AT44_9AGAM|nr:hypothetical protein SCLCIDRAFT_1001218 [Scleroderma citrinum Foug A]